MILHDIPEKYVLVTIRSANGKNGVLTIIVNTPTFHAINDNNIKHITVNESIAFLYIIYPLSFHFVWSIRFYSFSESK